MILHKQIADIISRDGLKDRSRDQNLVFKRIVLAKLLRDSGMRNNDIAMMFDRKHSTCSYWYHKYYTYVEFRDFRSIQSFYYSELGLETYEDFLSESLATKVLRCETWSDMRRLQEDLKKQLK